MHSEIIEDCYRLLPWHQRLRIHLIATLFREHYHETVRRHIWHKCNRRGNEN